MAGFESVATTCVVPPASENGLVVTDSVTVGTAVLGAVWTAFTAASAFTRPKPSLELKPGVDDIGIVVFSNRE